MSGILGIDLGTSNSAISVILGFKNDSTTLPVTIAPDGQLYKDSVVPSYIAFDLQGELKDVGLVAKHKYDNGSSGIVFRHIKRLIGRTYDYVEERISKNHASFLEFKDHIKRAENGFILLKVGPREISVTEMMSYLLKKLFDAATAEAKQKSENIDSIVISLPAGITDFQRQETLQAAILAGMRKDSISIIEEPTCAAIAKGLSGATGKIIVIDVGAGTTDVVIGHIAGTGGTISMQLTSRECDDLLGGMDMDYLMLEHVFHQNPELRTAYEKLGFAEKCRLMGKIEDAKRNGFSDGADNVVAVFTDMESRKIRVRADFDEAGLNRIVWPIVNGYNTTEGRKGIRVVIENALLQSACGNRNLIPKVIDELEHIILVGGPCRMGCMFDMLLDVFGSNGRLTKQLISLKETRLTDTFYMEGVSRGATLSKSEYIDGVMPITSEAISIYRFIEGGKTPVILQGQPYERSQGITKMVRVPVHKNANQWRVLHEKRSEPLRRWEMGYHMIIPSESGELEVTYKYGEAGTDSDITSIEGCGLRKIGFPGRQKVSTLGKTLEDGYAYFLSVIKGLPEAIDTARNSLYRRLIEEGFSADEARQTVQSKLALNQSDIDNCMKIQPGQAPEISEDEIKLALEKGCFELWESTAKNVYGLSQDVIDIKDRIIGLRPSSSLKDLMDHANTLLMVKPSIPKCDPYREQLSRYLDEVQNKPGDTDMAATMATALMVLADVLYDNNAIPESNYFGIRYSCILYRPEH